MYNKNSWKSGEIISDTKLNRMENGISENDIKITSLNEKIADINSSLDNLESEVNELKEGNIDSVIPSINGLATTNYVDTKVASIVNSAPETLDTLNELALALGKDPNFASTVANQIGTKVDKVIGKGLSTNDLTDALKQNYDTAYNHSISSHNYAPSSHTHNTVNGFSFWFGTQSQYDAIATKSNTTIYMIKEG